MYCNANFIKDMGRIYECPNGCGRKYKNRRSIWTHLKYECRRDKQFNCSYCGKNFARKGQLKSHCVITHRVIPLY